MHPFLEIFRKKRSYRFKIPQNLINQVIKRSLYNVAKSPHSLEIELHDQIIILKGLVDKPDYMIPSIRDTVFFDICLKMDHLKDGILTLSIKDVQVYDASHLDVLKLLSKYTNITKKYLLDDIFHDSLDFINLSPSYEYITIHISDLSNYFLKKVRLHNQIEITSVQLREEFLEFYSDSNVMVYGVIKTLLSRIDKKLNKN